MAVTAGWYHSALAKSANAELDMDTHTIKAMLTTSSNTINSGTDDYKDDITNEVTGTGYTAGGDTVAGTVAVVAANSWAVSRANSTAYALGDVVRPATGNGFLYQAIVAGTSGGSIPTYPTTLGGTVTDGSVTWECVGTGGVVFDTEDPTWTTSTITARQIHFYRDTGTASTSPLIAWVDLGADVSSTAATWTYVVDARGICFVVLP